MLKEMPAVRFAVDAIVGAAVFLGLTVALLGPSTAAQLLSTGSAPSTALPLISTISTGGYGHREILLLIAVVFSALFAMNLAFVRHINGADSRSEVRIKERDDGQRSVRGEQLD